MLENPDGIIEKPQRRQSPQMDFFNFPSDDFFGFPKRKMPKQGEAEEPKKKKKKRKTYKI